MPLTIELWEDSGILAAGRGTVIQEVDNLGWKNSDLDETFKFSDYPIGRPYLPGNTLTTSYKKYYYYKIYGTYSNADQPEIKFSIDPNGQATKLSVIYKWSNVYATPDTSLLSGTTIDPNKLPVWKPLLSTTGPNGTMSEITSLINNTTYFTPYLITQLATFPSDENDYGNLNELFELQLDLNENKTGLPGYDPALVNWSP